MTGINDHINIDDMFLKISQIMHLILIPLQFLADFPLIKLFTNTFKEQNKQTTYSLFPISKLTSREKHITNMNLVHVPVIYCKLASLCKMLYFQSYHIFYKKFIKTVQIPR